MVKNLPAKATDAGDSIKASDTTERLSMHAHKHAKKTVSYYDEEKQDTWAELTDECQLVLS